MGITPHPHPLVPPPTQPPPFSTDPPPLVSQLIAQMPDPGRWRRWRQSVQQAPLLLLLLHTILQTTSTTLHLIPVAPTASLPPPLLEDHIPHHLLETPPIQLVRDPRLDLCSLMNHSFPLRQLHCHLSLQLQAAIHRTNSLPWSSHPKASTSRTLPPSRTPIHSLLAHPLLRLATTPG